MQRAPHCPTAPRKRRAQSAATRSNGVADRPSTRCASSVSTALAPLLIPTYETVISSACHAGRPIDIRSLRNSWGGMSLNRIGMPVARLKFAAMSAQESNSGPESW